MCIRDRFYSEPHLPTFVRNINTVYKLHVNKLPKKIGKSGRPVTYAGDLFMDENSGKIEKGKNKKQIREIIGVTVS